MRCSALVPWVTVPWIVLATSGHAEVYRFRPIALTGDPVPGVAGAHFTWLGTAPMGPDDPAPLIDAQGNVSFGAGWVNQVTPHGLFAWRSGALAPIVLTGEPAIGTGSTFFSLPGIIPGPARIEGARTSFDGGFMPPGESFVEQGVWADRTGTREIIFQQSDHPPGAPAGARFFQWFHTMVAGRVVINARYSVGASSGINDHGFWRDDDGTLSVIALARTQAPGVPAGVLFGNGTPLNLGAFQEWDLGGDGRVTFNAMLMQGGATDLDDEGIWSEGTSGLQLLAREGDVAPGFGHPSAKLLGNSGFRTFGHDDVVDVLRNDAGHVAFGARVEVPGFNNRANAIYASRGAGLELVTYGMPSGSSTQGRPAPGFPAGTAFKRFPLGVRMNEAGALTFHATVGTANGSILDEVSGLFVERSGGIELIARTGDQAPGMPLGVTFTFGFPLSYLAGGHVVFIGGFNDGGRGLFVARPDGGVDHIISNGALFKVASGDTRVVDAFSTTGGASDARAIAISLNFSDGTDAIVLAEPDATVAVEPAAGGSPRLAVVGANPFARETAVAFDLPAAGHVRLVARDLAGREVAVLADGTRGAGRQVVHWDGTDAAARPVRAGIYFLTLEAGHRRESAKLVRIE